MAKKNVKQISVPYVPLPKQAEFHLSTAKYRCYNGGFGSGKTACGAMETLQIAHEYPGVLIGVFRETYRALEDSTKRTCMEWWPDELIEKQWTAENRLLFKNGSEVLFRSLDDPTKFKSTEFGFWWIDEATETSEESFLLLCGRLRQIPREDAPVHYPKSYPRKGILTTNPEGHDYVWRWFVDQRHLDEKQKKDYFLITAPTTENIFLPQDYIDNLYANYPEIWRKKYLFGSFDAFEGQIFSNFYDGHLFNINEEFPDGVPQDWERIIAVDYGYRMPTAVLWGAVDYDNNLWVYDEFYEKEWHTEDTAKEVLRRIDERKETILHRYIDPSASAQHGGHLSPIYEFAQHGLFLSPAERRVGGDAAWRVSIDRLIQRFEHNTIKISTQCENLIRELKTYKWKRQTPGSQEKEAPIKKNDHAVDALRYMIISLPMPPQKQKPKKEDGWRERRGGSNKHTFMTA